MSASAEPLRPAAEGGSDDPQIAGLIPLIYDHLRALAARYLQREGRYHTLQPTALVHEAYLRLAARNGIDWRGKTHFLAIAAGEMRRILVEHARAAKAQKRGGRPQRITLDEDLVRISDPTEALALDQALQKLAGRSRRQARVVEMRLFAGMSNREVGTILAVTERTVKKDWRMARAWLARELRAGSGA